MSKDKSHPPVGIDSLFSATDAELDGAYQPGLTEAAVWTRGDPIPMEVVKIGSRAFQSPDAFLDWMYQPHTSIDGDRPIDRLADANGVLTICQMLERLSDAGWEGFFQGAPDASDDFVRPEQGEPQPRESFDGDRSPFGLTDEDRAWLNDKPAGREEI